MILYVRIPNCSVFGLRVSPLGSPQLHASLLGLHFLGAYRTILQAGSC